MPKNLFIANPIGFCAGVVNAIDALNDLVDSIKDEKIYGFHEVVHNEYITKYFIDKGVKFTDNIEEIENESYIVISAHGVGENIINRAIEKQLKIVDLTCPLVSKVHRQISKLVSAGCNTIIYIGQKDHQESKGTLNRIKSTNIDYYCIYKASDIYELDIEKLNQKKIGYLSQTTLNSREVEKIIEKLRFTFSDIKGDDFGDLCHATKNRQGALEKIFNEKKDIDCLLVVGSQTSSNSKKLVEIGLSSNIDSYLVDNLEDIFIKIRNINDKNNIVLTAGASAPKILIDRIIKYFCEEMNFNQQIISYTDENIFFHPPKIIRDIRKKKILN